MGVQAIIPFGEGFLLGFGLIVGFGPQNAFILQQGIRRHHVLTVALLCSLIDGILILLAVAGSGASAAAVPLGMSLLTLIGAAFLGVYGWRSLRAAWRPPARTEAAPAGDGGLGLRAVVLAVFAVTLLNPLTYLDTMFVIGGSAARYGDALGLLFGAGATAASVVWFFTLSFGAARLGRLLRRRAVLRGVDTFSGLVMWLMAARLLWLG